MLSDRPTPRTGKNVFSLVPRDTGRMHVNDRAAEIGAVLAAMRDDMVRSLMAGKTLTACLSPEGRMVVVTDIAQPPVVSAEGGVR